MYTEKRNIKMFNLLTAVGLVAVLLTVVCGSIIQRQVVPEKFGGMVMNNSFNPMQPESAQTGPTGKVVLSVGLVLLIIASAILIVLLVIGLSMLYRNRP